MEPKVSFLSVVKREEDELSSRENSADKSVIEPEVNSLSSAVNRSFTKTEPVDRLFDYEWKPDIADICCLSDEQFENSHLLPITEKPKSEFKATDEAGLWTVSDARKDQTDSKHNAKREDLNAVDAVSDNNAATSKSSKTSGCETGSELKSTHTILRTVPTTLECTECGKRLATKGGLWKHMMAHTGERRYACPHCEKRYFQNSHLQVHMRRHTGEKPFMCMECGQRFTERSGLTNHKTMHSRERRYSCPHCERRFVRNSKCQEHVRRHTGEKPFACLHCDKHFTTKSDVTQHMNTHNTGGPYECPHCHKICLNLRGLKGHASTKHGVEKLHACNECDKRFRTRCELIRHAMTHSREIVNESSHCDTPIEVRGELEKLQTTHRNVTSQQHTFETSPTDGLGQHSLPVWKEDSEDSAVASNCCAIRQFWGDKHMSNEVIDMSNKAREAIKFEDDMEQCAQTCCDYDIASSFSDVDVICKNEITSVCTGSCDLMYADSSEHIYENSPRVSSQLQQLHSPTHDDFKTSPECEEFCAPFVDCSRAQESHAHRLALKQEPMTSAD